MFVVHCLYTQKQRLRIHIVPFLVTRLTFFAEGFTVFVADSLFYLMLNASIAKFRNATMNRIVHEQLKKRSGQKIDRAKLRSTAERDCLQEQNI